MTTAAILVAAGSGSRMGAPSPKAFLSLAGRPLVRYGLEALQTHPAIDRIVLMAPAGMLEQAERLAGDCSKVIAVALGGPRRQDTVRLGLGLVERSGLNAEDLVLVHDAARPLAAPGLFAEVLMAAARSGAAVPGVSPSDTVRRVADAEADGSVRLGAGTLDRGRIVLVQTPQAFRLGLILEAHERAGALEVTDDAALVESMGRPVEIVAGDRFNLKITTAEDIAVAEALLKVRGEPR